MSDWRQTGLRFFTCCDCRAATVQKGFDQTVLDTQCKSCRRQAGSYHPMQELFEAFAAVNDSAEVAATLQVRALS